MIPGAIDTIHTFHTYKLLKKDYAAKALKDEIIPVYSTVNRILFVPQDDFKDQFTVTLIETKEHASEVFQISRADLPEVGENAPSEESASIGWSLQCT